MDDEKQASEIDGSGYTRSDGETAGWAASPGGPWTITARMNVCGLVWLEEPATVRNDSLEVAADAITVTVR